MKSLFFEIITSGILVFGYYLNNRTIIFVALLAFIVRLLLGRMEEKLSILLYFVSWAFVMKLDMSSMSFYTIGPTLIMVLMIFNILHTKAAFDKRLLFLYLFFCVYILSTSLINGGRIANSFKYFGECAILIYASLYCKSYNYDKYVLAYSLGLLTSGITGLFLEHIESMAYNIKFYIINSNGQIITRFSGLNWDPNFFGLQVITCIGLLLVIYINKRNTYYIFIIIALSILGFLTISKTYLIVYLFQFLVFILYLIKNANKKNNILLSLLVLAAFLVIISFDQWFSPYIVRMSQKTFKTNILDNFTTGRLTSWQNYINMMTSSIVTLLFGVGIGSSSSAHNLYISAIYLFGIIGTIILCMLYYRCFTLMKPLKRQTRSLINYLPTLSTALYFFTLDGFLELFFIPQLILLLMSINYNNE